LREKNYDLGVYRIFPFLPGQSRGRFLGVIREKRALILRKERRCSRRRRIRKKLPSNIIYK